MIGLKIIGPIGIEAGPVYNYILTSTHDFDGNEINVQKSGIGYRIGAAVDFGRLNLNVAYQGIKNSSSDELSSYSSPNELIFGIGIGLGKSKR